MNLISQRHSRAARIGATLTFALLCTSSFAIAQEESAGFGVSDQLKSTQLTSEVKSLDDIRNLNDREKARLKTTALRNENLSDLSLPVGPPRRISSQQQPAAVPPKPSRTTPKREKALQKVKELKAGLTGGEDRKKQEELMRKALNEFFLADMQYRVEELDRIKRKVQETEANLQKRLAAKDESIDLQVKLLFQEAEGISVFGSSTSDTSLRGRRPSTGVLFDMNGPATPLGLPGRAR
ncbi:MAG TPA: hypothetical protein DDW52_10320 [Planctomycetaceae bacterium]|nr:hypothetical protein [Planctomycetaceae bacterium]